ncbi:MAG TPA: triple tyrosine motif-containing protein, partial [Chitinophagaceae bacterium]|nr:triple tyrosine motif-containing protein [Chitinophagaceae bacterium]
EANTDSTHKLPFRSNAISFDFAGLYYGVVPGIHYEYKLEGYDQDWVNAGKNFTAVYQNLPPGNFLFHARAKTSDGHITGEVSGFPFRIVPPFWRTGLFILIVALLAGAILGWVIYSLWQKLKMERMINSFATSLYGQNTTDDIFWDTARNCIEKLGFTDCVIYQRNESRDVFIQKAAYGPKNPYRREIVNVIEIPVGKGIVGNVAATGKAMLVGDTSKDPRYIVDDEKRLSEISVPVLVDGKVFAVIDSEHAQKNFYTRYHLRILKKIAAICSERITKHLAEERLRAKIARDLHDEMGSTLTSINIISKVAMEEIKEEEKIKQSFQKIKDHSGRMMESMSDMVWVINPVNDNFGKVILRMKEFAAEILEPARINYHFAEEGILEQVQLNLEQRKDIYMIFKEAVNNIVKYSGATEAGIRLQKTSERLTMTIMDNGKGFDVNVINPGNGLKNMQSRATEMGATLDILSGKEKGTVIELGLSLT